MLAQPKEIYVECHNPAECINMQLCESRVTASDICRPLNLAGREMRHPGSAIMKCTVCQIQFLFFAPRKYDTRNERFASEFNQLFPASISSRETHICAYFAQAVCFRGNDEISFLCVQESRENNKIAI